MNENDEKKVSIDRGFMEALITVEIDSVMQSCFGLIARDTYGAGQDMACIGIKRFSEAAKESQHNVAPALDKLQQRNMIIVKDREWKWWFGIQEDYNEWINSPEYSGPPLPGTQDDDNIPF